VTSRVEVLSTSRLLLHQLCADDAEFMLELLNEEPFLLNIGDRGVRTPADAAAYIVNGPVASYEQFGFGLYAVELKKSGESIGICGLLKRESLDDVDIGFAFLEKFWGQGYAYESAAATLDYGRNVLGLKRIIAITTPTNQSSIKLLEKIGLRFEKMIQMPGHHSPNKLFASDS
jgi:[ribosomal protein S5]-alanine N-acetyltransferase